MLKKVEEELNKLEKEGKELAKKITDEEIDFRIKYQIWYTKALKVVEQILPDRYDEFVMQYRNDRRKELNYSTYVISDFCMSTALMRGGKEVFSASAATVNKFLIQLGIIFSIRARLETELSNIRGLLESEIFDNEIDSAKNLLKKGYTRAAGAICGVVLEKHFSEIANNHKLLLEKKNPTIADYNELFKKETIYDIPTWRNIEYLGDLRNLCDHDKKVEPTKEQIDNLISGTDKIVKTIF